MDAGAPRVLPTLIIGDDSRLIARLSSLLLTRRAYLALLDGPRIHRSDLAAEIVRRSNAAARLQPEQIIFAGLSATTGDLFATRLPPTLVRRIATIEDFDRRRTTRTPELVWGPINIGVGLLHALRARREITFDDNAPPRPMQLAVHVGFDHLISRV
jgi:hypothetical protein